jgi:putative ABC transport system permease protein
MSGQNRPGVTRFFDRWREILEVLWRRKLRTTLTALSVAWGIFMLVLLLAAGQGLSNGARAEFQRNAQNSVYVFPGRMSQPHQGNPIGKVVQLRNDDQGLTKRTLPNIELASARADLGRQIVRRGKRSSGFTVKGCLPDNAAIESTVLLAGRFISPDDQREKRKVAAIGLKVKQTLFPGDEQPLGAAVEIGHVVFTVVGVFEEQDEQAEQETLYLPLSTTQLVWGRGDRLDRVLFTLQEPPGSDTSGDVETLKTALAAHHGYARDDPQAVFLWSSDEVFLRFQGLIRGIQTFVWLIGLGTILAGVVGVSNIMLISVRERTREIGVRKAVGAPPSAIIAMILQESLAITLVSGYLGLVAAVAAVTGARALLPVTPYFRNPDVDLGVGLAATAVLTIAGMLAGLFPARQAARINPIAALRVE